MPVSVSVSIVAGRLDRGVHRRGLGLPVARINRIAALNQRVIAAQKEETAQYDAAGEVLFMHALPVRSDLVIWTMGRAHVRAAAAFERLAVGFVALGTWVAAAPGSVPGLTEPGSAQAMKAMSSMKGTSPMKTMPAKHAMPAHKHMSGMAAKHHAMKTKMKMK